jgi:L-threonylcarbamoyladenylate synthase
MADAPTPAPTRLLTARPGDVAEAATLLRDGELVAFPTETVYGLGVDATNAEAIARLYAAKGRPARNPLIIHVADAETAERWAGHWGKRAATLAQTFWPGPLTLVVPSGGEVDGRSIAPAALAGGATIGLRCPDHPVALAILREVARPLAAPSANRSGHVSPTTAAHVLADLSGRIAAVVDGGECGRGLESTVLDLTGAVPRLLRPGPLPRRILEVALGDAVATLGEPSRGASSGRGGRVDDDDILRSPGLLDRHYAPRTPTRLATRKEAEDAPAQVAVLRFDNEELSSPARLRWAIPADPERAGRLLYGTLREIDAHGACELLIVPPSLADDPAEEHAWEAIRDRIRRDARLTRGPGQPFFFGGLEAADVGFFAAAAASVCSPFPSGSCASAPPAAALPVLKCSWHLSQKPKRPR